MIMFKQNIVKFLRCFKLLSFAEYIRSRFHLLISIKKIRDFNKDLNNKNFILPPFNVAYDAYAVFDPYCYLNQGKNHALFVSELIKKYKDIDIGNIYEWGCGPMRVLRHLPSMFEGRNINYFGSDYNKETVLWAKQNFKDIEISLNQLSPPLPFRSSTFDIIYSISVFTHLSEELTKRYISDIYRILKKGGIFISTFHGDLNSKLLTNSEKKQFNSGQYIERGGVLEGSRIFASYQPDKFILDNFSKFKVMDKIKNPTNDDFQQDWWVFRKI